MGKLQRCTYNDFNNKNDQEKLSYICDYIDSIETEGFDENEFIYLRSLIPAYDVSDGQDYIFISYSHKDYKKVFKDLAYFSYWYRKGRFWYDESFELGVDWKADVKKHIRDRNCVGIVFYISENLIMSSSVVWEIKTVDKIEKDYCAISLSDKPTVQHIYADLSKKMPLKYMLFRIRHLHMVTLIKYFFPQETTTLFKSEIQSKIVNLDRKFHVFSDDIRNKKRDELVFGEYPTRSAINKQPIEWIVLERVDKKALVVSKYGIDCIPFNNGKNEVTWESCSIRKWLNEDFYNSAFSESEKEQILLSIVKNNEKYDGVDTKDCVFLLSINEARNFFVDDNDRLLVPTPYAVSRGSFVSGDTGLCSWRLRTQLYDNCHSSFVHTGGYIDVDCGYPNDYKKSTVRPAMWIITD